MGAVSSCVGRPCSIPVMLHLRRFWKLGELAYSQSELRSPGFIVVRQRTNAPYAGDARRADGWATATLLLAGRGDEEAAATLPAVLNIASVHDPTFAVPPDSDLLKVFWRSDVPMSSGRGPEVDRAAATALADAMEVAGPIGPTVAAGLRALTEGVVPPSVVEGALRHRPEAEMVAVARAVERLSVRLAERPAITDVARELGIDVKRASELAVRYFRRYHATVDGWRQYLNGLRLELGASAMRSGRFEAAEVARLLGFTNASSFSHAFQRAGWPAPSQHRPPQA